MAEFTFIAFPTDHLVPQPGSDPISQGETNGTSSVGDSFEIGTNPGTQVTIDDPVDGFLADGISQEQILIEPAECNGITYAAGTHVWQSSFSAWTRPEIWRC